MYTLGINAVYHDSAAALVHDGVVIAAAEDERFTHVKHAKRPVPFSTWQLPFDAIDYCLREAGITLADIDHVAYSYDPSLLPAMPSTTRGGATVPLPLQPSLHRPADPSASPWDPLFLTYIVNARDQLVDGAPHHLARRFRAPEDGHRFAWHYVEHHLAHEASAFLAAPYGDTAVLTMDGRGEGVTTSLGQFAGGHYKRLKQVELPHSLGLLYEAVTAWLGFLHSSDEYKVMALGAFGTPAYADVFREIVRYRGDGSYTVDEPRLVERFGAPRERGGPLEQRHYDIAASLQLVLEETVLELANWLHARTGLPRLCMAGGVALNCVMNARIRDKGPFDEVWVQPAAGDAGTALGAGLWIDWRERGRLGDHERRWAMDHAYLGPAYSDPEIEQFLRWSKVPFERLTDVAAQTADLLASGQVIGWFQGRTEFGPRALGARSILASPVDPQMQAKLNEIKDREDFRPVAPVVMEELAADWFVGARTAPFMLFIFDVRPERAERIPAVRHVDGTARVQTINRQQHPLYYDLLAEFHARTGVPILVNTSFNTRGEPMVNSPRDALESFWTSPLDALVIGPFLIRKDVARGSRS
ncbi:carbamoyltransferase C-terminal domain-containing protein [Trinickia caryophylli]|uniref:Beta-1,4-N-acetylglucosamine oligosaccharide 6-O-carbamoyltransferase NodU n=1 Tax=Trinickia caryophylli TaxID=28094 RepID=A0A1X7EC55_TRICW|nr:carbamoyltransferase C-terminal domain-containing protein [Trinickia caryophylli]PMS12949.1 carbamoyltransferase [Trinickia caryophylli]TRX14709.1 carbamoyltransferase [Trinickia caryophylli]WQE14552.1 carbamoyltransferase C-terminal domain-containing protein [Trinickia caryophylli]SMF30959.1 beta-1,4-N-acetylglucosamine oligosaccharide 6-O-carbamoyltransferase NodU [Trinickia caryophylli]GLU32038.1 carbamoyltransferase [Trinickia caryophylli]